MLSVPGRRSASVWWIWLALAGTVAFMSVGMLPFTGAEGDDYAIASGIAQIDRAGLASRSVAYRYDAQPGSYLVSLAVSRLTGASALNSLCAVSALAGIVFVLVSALFISRVTDLPVPVCGLVVLLFPESWAGAYYGNTVTIAAACGVCSLALLAADRRLQARLAAGALLGVAVWLRLDAALYGVAAVLLAQRESSRGFWRAAAPTLSVCGIVATALLVASDVSIPAVVAEFLRHQEIAHGGGISVREDVFIDLKSYLVFFTIPSAALVALGVIDLVQGRRGRRAALALAGIAPFALAYLGSLTTPKYLYYTIPFWAIVACHAWPVVRRQWHSARGRAVLAIVAFAALAQAGVGVGRTGEFISLGRPLWDGPVPVSLGPGRVANTHDGPRLLTGTAFLPFLWREYKMQQREFEREVSRSLDSSSSMTAEIRVPTWGDRAMYNYLLASRGSRHVRTVELRPAGSIEEWETRRGRYRVVEDHTVPEWHSFHP